MAESEYRPRKSMMGRQMAKPLQAKPVTPQGDIASLATESLIREYHRQCRGHHPIVARAIALQLADALRTMAECISIGKEERDD